MKWSWTFSYVVHVHVYMGVTRILLVFQVYITQKDKIEFWTFQMFSNYFTNFLCFLEMSSNGIFCCYDFVCTFLYLRVGALNHLWQVLEPGPLADNTGLINIFFTATIISLLQINPRAWKRCKEYVELKTKRKKIFCW